MNIRVVKETYTSLSNVPIIDENLSAVALGIFVYIMSKPNNWKAHKSEIYKRFEKASIKTTKNIIDSAFSELLRAGYIKLHTPTKKNEQGKTVFLGKEYIFFESPQKSSEFEKCQNVGTSENYSTSEHFRQSEKLAHIVNTDLIVNTDNNIIITDNKNIVETSSSSSQEHQNEQLEFFEQPICSTEPKKEKSCAKKEKAEPREKSVEEVKYYQEVMSALDRLQELTNTKLKIPDTYEAFTRYGGYKMIAERLKNGATLDELIMVIEFKCHEWMQKPNLRQYLTYHTLFAAKNFENYLMQIQVFINNQQNNQNGQQTNNNGNGGEVPKNRWLNWLGNIINEPVPPSPFE